MNLSQNISYSLVLYFPSSNSVRNIFSMNRFKTEAFRTFVSLLDRSSIKKNQGKKWPNKFDKSFCICYLCLFVCLSVPSLQVTVFVVGSWFLAWGILEWIPQNAIFCFWKFWDLTYLWLFLDFLGVFCYISFVNFERVFRPNQMTQRLEIWYIGSSYAHKMSL